MAADAGEVFMRRALRLAARGQGRVEPNPMVGCVIVRAGRVIGEGWHRRFGGPHAEVDALRRCTASPRGATVYVTLEPCCHHGKTPPCTDALIAAGVGHVVAAMRDPSPRVAGRGLRMLREAGIEAHGGLMAGEARQLNAPFLKLLRHARPWVIAKWAQSVDGKLATRTGDTRWITDATMRAHAHRVRGRVDAILVGVGTVLADDPSLTCRDAVARRPATRVVLDGRLRTPASARLVRGVRDTPTWVFCGPRAPKQRQRALERAGCLVHRVRTDRTGVSLATVLETLGRAQMTNVLVEGGGRLLGRFCELRLIDEVNVYMAPLLIGGRDAVGALHGEGFSKLANAVRLDDQARMRRLGTGWLLEGRTS